jgi:twitching motility protein PilT
MTIDQTPSAINDHPELNEFQQLLKHALEAGASDLHISVRSRPMLRIDGVIKPYGEQVLLPDQTEGYARMIMTEDQFHKFKQHGELDFSCGVPGTSRFRINVYQQRGTVSIAARIIQSRIPSLEELNLPPILTKLTAKQQGLVLITGPTGSGKSTTLAAMIDYMNRAYNKHIITLEDPIEYLHRHGTCVIDQREIGYDSKSFATAMRAVLRQDPDVILVGEMRDPETIATAITAAETGHLVFATLHTPDAAQTIDRIVDSFPGEQQGQIRLQLSSVLTAVVSQRLLPRKSGKGRVCATEIMLNSPAIGNLIRLEKVHQIRNILQTSSLLGMHTLDMSLKQLVQRGEVEETIARMHMQTEGTV